MNRSVLARQMFAKGGQAVPNEYKGFSMLPEEVQMKMDPVAAKKYQEGGSVNYNEGFPRDPIMDRALALETSREFGLDPREYSQMMRDPEFLAQARSMDMTPEELRRQQIQMMPGQRQGSLQAEADRMGITLEELLRMLRGSEKPVGMAMGGDPAMAQGVGSMMPPPPAMPPAPPPMEGGQAIDPQVLEGALATAEQEITNLDQAEDFETVMNTIRGDEATVEERYEELASVVGEEDARQTPESVLTLVQPAMVMGAVDQGIGGLAQQQMMEPVQGAMAQGIMSTVEPPQPAGGMGGPPPVNFKEGGLVRRGDNQPVKMMQTGGDPFADVEGRLGELARERMAVRQGLIGDPSARIKQQEDLTKSQMLFDIANTALAFAAPMEGERPGASAAERLAMAARTTQLPQTIGARAAKLGEFKTGLEKEKQALQLAALGSAETALAAEAKAAEALKLQEIKGAQDIAKLKLENKLDTALQTSLKQMGITADSSLEDQKQANRIALENVEQGNRTAIEQLKATGRQSDLVLANQLEKENIILRGNIKLDQMGVANEYDLEKLELSQGFEREINNTNNALKEKLSGLDREISERRLALEEKKAEVAEAQGERKLELQAEANAMEADLNAFTMNYKTEKLDLERAAARLTRLGTSTEARITTLISDPESLAKYAAGTMTPEETLEFNQAIAYYNAPKQVWNEKEKRFVLSPGNPLSNELMASIQLRDNRGLTVPNIKLDAVKTPTIPKESKTEVKSAITEGLTDEALEAAFGSLPFAKSLANDLVEAFSFGQTGAPFKASKDAITAAETLNTRTIQVFQKSADLRESVTQLNLLKDRTPEPAAFFTGPNKAASKIKAVLGMIQDEKVLLEKYLESDQYPMGSKEYMEATTALDKLNQLEAGYKVFENAYTRVGEAKMEALQRIIKKK